MALFWRVICQAWPSEFLDFPRISAWFFAVGASLFDGVRKAVSSTAFAALRATLQPVSGDSGDQTDGTDLRTLWEVDRTVAAVLGFILGIGGLKNGELW
jgi:hypothetical protein